MVSPAGDEKNLLTYIGLGLWLGFGFQVKYKADRKRIWVAPCERMQYEVAGQIGRYWETFTLVPVVNAGICGFRHFIITIKQ